MVRDDPFFAYLEPSGVSIKTHERYATFFTALTLTGGGTRATSDKKKKQYKSSVSKFGWEERRF